MRGATTPPTFDLGPARMRPFEPEDAAAWLEVVTDPAITSCTSWSLGSPAEAAALVARIVRGYVDGSSRRWAIDVPGHGLAGSCGFKWWDARNGSAEIAYELAPRFWRRGITMRAVRAALDHGFSAMSLSRVEATVMVANAPSIRLLEAAGFTREGRLRECRVCAGARRDFYVYGLLQPEAAAGGSSPAGSASRSTSPPISELPSGELGIRAAAPDDAPAIAALLGELGYPAEPRAVSARLASLSAQGDLLLVARRADGPVGLASVHLVPLLHRDARLARITAFVVSSRARGAGVGAALLRACEAWAVEGGAERIEVTSGDAREGAHRFYAKRGFVREGVRFTKPLTR